MINMWSGILKRKGKRYLFRSDDATYDGVIAWDIDLVAYKVPRNKWKKLPKGEIDLFSLDNPPETVSYIPLLAPFE